LEIEQLTSAKPKNTPRPAQNRKKALRIFGAAYGNFCSHSTLPNKLG
jgi:hypothetical protein